MGLSRVPFLARLAKRYALRHRGQTLRAVAGLLVATTVLATGLGMGESIAVSLEEAALAQFGPIDISLTAQQAFDAELGDALAERAGLEGVAGASTLRLTGAVSNPRTGLAEAAASIRGVSPVEAATLGPLTLADGGGAAPEPQAGEVVLGTDLATRLDARVGDIIVLRAQPPNATPSADLDTFNATGLAGAPAQPPEEHTFFVRDEAIGVGAQVSWQTGAGATVRATLRAPSGVTYANESASAPLVLLVPGPVEGGTWTLLIEADAPTPYFATGGAAYGDVTSIETARIEATLVAIVESEGRAAITRRPVALVSMADLQEATGAQGEATAAYYTVMGDPYAARDALEAALPASVRDSFRVRAEKADAIAEAEEAGAEITGFLIGMGGFTLLASVLLAFTLFSALVEERRAELGIARALGLTRGEVAFAMTLEGGLYAFAAALVGLGLGLGILWGLLTYIGQEAAAQGAPLFAMHVSPLTVLLALAIGTLLPLATIGIASLRFARLDPARAIRGIPDDPKGRRRFGIWVAVVLVALGGLASIDPIWRLAGIPVLLAGVAVALQSVGRPMLSLGAAAAGFAHATWTLYTFDAFPEDAGELDPILTLTRGALIALGFAALAVAAAKPYRALARLAASRQGPRLSAFVAVRYLLARRRPVGLTMAMVGLVVVIITVMGTLFASVGATIPDNEAGYGVIGEAGLALDGFPTPLPDDVASQVARADFLPRHIEFQQANVTRGGEQLDVEAGLRQFLGVTESFATANEYALATRAPAYATDRDAWDAVARGDAMLVPEWALERNGLAPGDVLTVRTGAFGPKEYVLAGGVDSDFVFQTFLPADDVRAMGFPQTTTVFVRIAPGGDPDVVAHRLTDLYAEQGVSFTSIREEVARILQNVQALVLVFQAFLALGLFVGLAATGFLAARAVHERMREIGTLRALGYEGRDVQRAFVMESMLTAGVGLLLGTVAGLIVAHSIWWRNLRDDGAPFRPPWLIILGFALVVLALAAFASRGPAKRAAALPPAIAVRHVE